MLEIVKRVGLLSGKILSWEGALFPTFRAFSFCFLPQEEEKKRSELAYILGLEKKLSPEGFYLKLLSSHISKIHLIKDEPIIYVSCPRIPADLKATTACITTLLKWVMRFVMRITLNLTSYLKTSQ